MKLACTLRRSELSNPNSHSLKEMKRMSRLLKLAGIPALAIGLALLSDGTQAQAGGFSISIGNYGYRGYGGRTAYRPYYGRSHRPRYNYSRAYHSSRAYHGRRGGYGGYSGSYHHPRVPHYDYHAPSLVPHGNHLDYIPGHYDFHHGGHIGH